MATEEIDNIVSGDYKLGFEVDIETETVPPGLDENTITFIYNKKVVSLQILLKHRL